MAQETSKKVDAPESKATIVVSGNKKWYSLRGPSAVKNRYILATIVAVVLLGAGVAWYASKDEPKQVTKSTESSAARELTYQERFDDDLAKAQDNVADFDKVTSPKLKMAYGQRYQDLGVAYDNVGKSADAIAAYKKAIELNPNLKLTTLGALTMAYDANGQKALAIATCEEYLALLRTQPKDDISSATALAAYTTQLEYLKTGKVAQ